MKQIVRKGLKDVVVEEVPDPLAVSHHVLIRSFYSLISSGTETASLHQEGVINEIAHNPSHLQKIWGAMKVSGPERTLAEVRAKFSELAAIGYSGAGIVIDRHPTVTDLEIGQRVAYGGEGTGHAETVLAGRNLVARVPDAVPFEHACFTTLGAISMNAIRQASIGLGDVVAVIGMGIIGQLVAQLASAHGARVIGLDLRQNRLSLAQSLGVDHVLLDRPSTTTDVQSLTGGKGVDCVIVAAAAKSSAPCLRAIDICRDRGRIVVVGAVEMNLPRDEMYRKEIQLVMSRAYGPGSYDATYEQGGKDYPYPYVRWTENRNMEEFLRLVEAQRVRVQPLITHQFALEDATKAYETILNPASDSLAVLVQYPAALEAPQSARPAPQRRVNVTNTSGASSKLGVALVGPGGFARWVHLPNLKKIPNAELRAVYSTSGVRGKSYATRFGASYCASDYQEILSDKGVDVVLITSRHQHHFSQALAALQAGKHVFVEKPMAVTEEECRVLCQAAEASGRYLTVGFNRRFAALYRQQKDALRSRTSPAIVNCRMNSPGLSGAYWAADLAIGGAIVSEACHFVDLMYWLVDAEPLSVAAFCLPTGREPVGENNMVASFRYADGSVGNLTYCTVGSRTSGGERVDVYASGVGAITEDFKHLTVQGAVRRRRSHWFVDRGHASQLQAFLEGIVKGTAPDVTPRDGARATVGCLRMLEAARTLQPCTIDLDRVLG